jgi:HK97 gp10 family phage protein
MALGKVTATTTGKKNLDRMFRQLKTKVKDKELRKGHRSAARVLVKAERAEFQKVAVNRTGATERSIGTKNEKNVKGQVGAISVGPRITRNRERSGWKAWWFEKGTKFMSARPFVGPAWDRVQDQVQDIIGDKLGKTMERTMRRNAKKF